MKRGHYRKGSATDLAVQYVHAHAGKPVTSRDVAAALGVSHDRAYRALEKAAELGCIAQATSDNGRLKVSFDRPASLEAFGRAAVERMSAEHDLIRGRASTAARRVAAAPRATRHTAGPSKIKCDPCAIADYSRATFTCCTSPRYVAAWQSIPDSGRSIFADLPIYGGAA